MSDESFISEELMAMLKAQMEYREQQKKLEASLTDHEKAMRAKFEKAMSGEVGPLELCSFNVSSPITLLVFAEAYRREALRLRATVPEQPTKKALAAMDPTWVEHHAKKRKDHLESATAHEFAQWTLVAIWMAARGHQQFIDHFAGRVRMPMLPLLPRDWWQYRESVYAAMGEECPTWPKVTRIHPAYPGHP
jgi:hypothetical protein